MNESQSQNLVSSCGFSREMNINIDVKWQMWPGARLCCVLKSPYITAQWDFIQCSSIDDDIKNDATVADIADNTDTHLSWLPSCSLYTITPGLWHQHWWNTQLTALNAQNVHFSEVSDIAWFLKSLFIQLEHAVMDAIHGKCAWGLNLAMLVCLTCYTMIPSFKYSTAIKMSLCCHNVY